MTAQKGEAVTVTTVTINETMLNQLEAAEGVTDVATYAALLDKLAEVKADRDEPDPRDVLALVRKIRGIQGQFIVA